MIDVEQAAKELIELYKYAETFKDKLRSVTGGKYGVEQVVDSYLSIFDRFCPYKVGDRVKLAKTLDIPEDSGWYHHRHFLIQGEPGVITYRGYRGNRFEFYVQFDNDTWIDREGIEHPTENKGNFCLTEDALEPVEAL